ncbi:MAG: hypothetical protein ABWY52_01665 [Candidatus Limnocylindrales bacterium]
MPDGPVMPFPFLPWGVVVAGVVLGGMVGLFMLVVHLLDRAATEVSGTMLPGLVRGVRQWSGGPISAAPPPSSPMAVDPEPSLDPIVDEPLPTRERLHPHIR